MKKQRTSVWVDPELVLHMHNKGIEISPFLNRCMTEFLGMPVGAEEVLFRKQTEYIATQLQAKYAQNIEIESTNVLRHNQDQALKRAAEDQKSAELLEFGADLMKIPCFPKFLKDLQERNCDSNYLQIALAEFNRMNSRNLEDYDLWNMALEWYEKFGNFAEFLIP